MLHLKWLIQAGIIQLSANCSYSTTNLISPLKSKDGRQMTKSVLCLMITTPVWQELVIQKT